MSASHTEPRPADAAGSSAPLPALPWRLSGPALVALLRVRTDAVRTPARTAAIPAGPGRAFGLLVLVAYEPGSTLVYDELVVGTLVAGRAGAGILVSHIYVDDDRSRAGGRELWGLPKEIVRFRRDGVPGDGRVELELDGRPVAAIEARAPRLRVPLPGIVPVLGTLGGHLRLTLGRSLMDVGPALARVEVPDGSPLAALGIAGAHPAIAGRARRLVFPPPRMLGGG